MTHPAPDAAQIRFRVDPADVPVEKAARRLHLSPERFTELLPRLRERGFPPADETTGMYDLEAIDAWRASRHRQAAALTTVPGNSHPATQDKLGDMAERFIAARGQTTGRRRYSGAA
jgi:hypothetical protein